MSASDDPRRIHFQSPEYLVDRLDAIAELFDKDRTDLLIKAMREYIEDTTDSETFQELSQQSTTTANSNSRRSRNRSALKPLSGSASSKNHQ